ncbi:MAG: hypothetical protein PHD72_01360 [Patescibacteria group bacterium]|nr:hypothetical protein [Patescibacteria group bacterium]
MEDKKRKFSMHPKLAAVIDLALNIATLVWLPTLPNWQWFGLWFVARAVLWAFFIRVVYYPPEQSRWRHWFTLIFFNFGIVVSLLIFIDWQISWYLLSGMFVLFSAISFWLLPAGEADLTFFSKPYRRWLFLMDAFGLAGFWCGLYAVISFQILLDTYFLLLAILGAAVSTLISAWWWRAYNLPYNSRFWLSLGVSFLLVLELAWVVWRWPLGYLINGIIIIWFWYNWWLICRFNLTKEGIDWKKQKFFFFFDFLLLAAFLFAAQWR